MNKAICFLLLIIISCKTNEGVLSKTMTANNVLIYKVVKPFDYDFNNNKYIQKAIGLAKINKKEKTIQFESVAYKEDEKPNLNKKAIDSLFLGKSKEYFKIKGNIIKTETYKTKYKRAWNDFATPSSSKTGGDKYIIKNDKLITPSRVEYILDKNLTIQEN